MLKKGSKVYSLEALNADPLATRNTILFAALTALGIPPEVELCGEYVETVGGRPKAATVWRLAEQSIDGRFKTGEMIKHWNDPDFAKKHPEHPLAYIQCAFNNRERAVDFLKDQGPIVMKRRGNKIGFITRHTSEADKRRIIDGLNEA
ncbi:MAG: hypothetical protein P4L99_28105 [Chthoniobacter sp.]|nr:hypothetical protein [Chthoniobacter sp.]